MNVETMDFLKTPGELKETTMQYWVMVSSTLPYLHQIESSYYYTQHISIHILTSLRYHNLTKAIVPRVDSLN